MFAGAHDASHCQLLPFEFVGKLREVSAVLWVYVMPSRFRELKVLSFLNETAGQGVLHTCLHSKGSGKLGR